MRRMRVSRSWNLADLSSLRRRDWGSLCAAWRPPWCVGEVAKVRWWEVEGYEEEWPGRESRWMQMFGVIRHGREREGAARCAV